MKSKRKRKQKGSGWKREPTRGATDVVKKATTGENVGVIHHQRCV